MTQSADYQLWLERFAKWFRAANIVVAVLGVFLLGWLFTVIQQPEWRDEVSRLTVTYFFLQISPMLLLALYAIVRYKLRKQQPQEAKRKAILQRRGLFDFVSPFVVVVAILTYVLFIVYGLYLDHYVWLNTSPSKECYNAIAAVTLVYALNAFVIYKALYGRNNPLVTHEGRVLAIGIAVKCGVYGCIATAWFISIIGTLGPAPELQAWRPFALSVFLMINMLLGVMTMIAPPRKPEADGLGSTEVTS